MATDPCKAQPQRLNAMAGGVPTHIPQNGSRGLTLLFFVASAFRPVWPGRCIWALSVYRSRLAPWTRGESNHGKLSALRPLCHGRYRFATASNFSWVQKATSAPWNRSPECAGTPPAIAFRRCGCLASLVSCIEVVIFGPRDDWFLSYFHWYSGVTCSFLVIFGWISFIWLAFGQKKCSNHPNKSPKCSQNSFPKHPNNRFFSNMFGFRDPLSVAQRPTQTCNNSSASVPKFQGVGGRGRQPLNPARGPGGPYWPWLCRRHLLLRRRKGRAPPTGDHATIPRFTVFFAFPIFSILWLKMGQHGPT